MNPSQLLCKGCGQPVTPPRRCWCEDAFCKLHYLAQHYASFAYSWVRQRDHAICRDCGLDCAKLEADMLKWWLNDRRHYARMRKLFPYYRPGVSYSEIHHEQERAEGGSDHPSNLVTLCCACHKARTAEFNRRRNDIAFNRQRAHTTSIQQPRKPDPGQLALENGPSEA